MSSSDTYVLGRTDRETQRLILQHQIYGPITRRFFQTAGIGPGMKVLDIGSGAGDVALLAADLVGPSGRVVGIDMNAAILDTARARVAAAGWTNVTFNAGDVREITLDSDFDAVIGRWVLMYVPEAAALLRHLARRLRAGGIVAFHENDFTYPPTVFPPSDLTQQIQRWAIPPHDTSGATGGQGPQMRMGTQLFKTYLDAGLPAPQLIVEAPVGGGKDWPGYEYLVETFRSLLPALQKMAGIDPAQVGIDTLAARLRDDVVQRQGVQMLPLMFGAWSHKAG
jgi:ubiquinone/menaquinone biosynthesis C-methylase UbiE